MDAKLFDKLNGVANVIGGLVAKKDNGYIFLMPNISSDFSMKDSKSKKQHKGFVLYVTGNPEKIREFVLDFFEFSSDFFMNQMRVCFSNPAVFKTTPYPRKEAVFTYELDRESKNVKYELYKDYYRDDEPIHIPNVIGATVTSKTKDLQFSIHNGDPCDSFEIKAVLKAEPILISQFLTIIETINANIK